ncbi:MAG TPA: hypothetical protein VHE57_00265, partial [Mycobacteriales bacterium]|nr:hypothetical protein [Mycobacteriales bacterium]
MIAKQREQAQRRERTADQVTIDLNQVPYFEPEPLVLREASGLERVRETTAADEGLGPNYRLDRPPRAADDSMFFGGLGLAATMDVGAHPVRARLRRINVLTLLAITAIAG